MIHTQEKNYTIYNASCLDVMDDLPENSIDCIVTDPPYEIGFMGKGWDNTGIAFSVDTYKKCLRVLKPGGYILAFNHSRTFHRMAVAIEDAGFEIRDTILWLYGSGFPKSYDVSKGIDKLLGCEREITREKTKPLIQGDYITFDQRSSVERERRDKPSSSQAKQWQGWGSALKPSYEPIIMARKPLQGTIAQNVLKWGVGGINIDECRVGNEERFNAPATPKKDTFNCSFNNDYEGNITNGRFPANTIHDGSDEVVELFPNDYEIEDSAARFFYTAKASKKDRDEGLISEFATVNDGRKKSIDNPFQRGETPKRNIHPTVKPTDLMQYLIRLVAPKGSIILDPFMGSGSTGKAAMIENNERNADYKFIGIDLEQEYCDIAKARIEYGINYRENLAKIEEQEKIVEGQINMFEVLE